jgi:4-amino-4-deoxy-L-arabinose transferase-like glycosyltransferase
LSGASETISTPDTTPPSPPRRINSELLFVLLITAAAFLLRIWGISRLHFWDENVYLQDAEVICCGKTNYSELDCRPPLLSLIFAAVFLLWNSTFAACIATALINSLGVVFAYLCGRIVAARAAASIAALLFAFCPFFVSVFPRGFVSDDTGTSLLTDSPAVTLILLAFFLLLRALRVPSGLRFAAAGVALALAVLMRFGSLSTVAILSLLVFAAPRWWRAALATAVGFAAAIAPYLLWSRLRYGGLFTTFVNAWNIFDGEAGSPFFYLKNFVNIFSWITLAGLALYALRSLADTRTPCPIEPQLLSPNGSLLNHRGWLEAFLWLWALAALLFFSCLPHKEPRYIMPIEPPVFLLAAIGLATLVELRSRPRRIAGSALLAVALALAFAPDWHRFHRHFIDPEVSEEMRVSDFLTRTLPAATILYTNFNYPEYAYYTRLTVYGLSADDPVLYDQLNRLPSEGVLIAYKPSDEIASPSLAWLDANPRYKRLREFPLLILYTYTPQPGDSLLPGGAEWPRP